MRLGMDLTEYMESHIRASDYILLVCTPAFAVRADAGKGGVGYEKMVITGEIYRGAEPTKFIPLLRSGDPKTSLPSYLKNKLFVDFRNEASFDSGIEAIVRHASWSPDSEPPPLGSVTVRQITGTSYPSESELPLSFSSLIEYIVQNYKDLDVTPGHVAEIVENLQSIGYKTVQELDMSIRPVRQIAKGVDCVACRRYACDQITLALGLSNPRYAALLGPHQAEHAQRLRDRSSRPSRKGWL
jgi:hypothetical protein